MSVVQFDHELGMTGARAYIGGLSVYALTDLVVLCPYPWRAESFFFGDVALVVTRHVKSLDVPALIDSLVEAKTKEEEVNLLRAPYYSRKFKATEYRTGFSAGMRDDCKASEVEVLYRGWLESRAMKQEREPVEYLKEVRDKAIEKKTFIYLQDVVFTLRQWKFANMKYDVRKAIEDTAKLYPVEV